MPKKLLLSVISIFVLLVAIAFLVMKIQKKTLPQGVTNKTENTFQAGWDAAKQRLAQSQYAASIPVGVEIKSVYGVIQKIDQDKITIKITPLEPLADPVLDLRTVIVDSNTKITLTVEKEQVQFQKEMADYKEKTSQAQKESDDATIAASYVMPPSPFENKEIKLSELKEGQGISANAARDIKEEKEFVALTIDAQEFPASTLTSVPMPSINEVTTIPAKTDPASTPELAIPVDNISTLPSSVTE